MTADRAAGLTFGHESWQIRSCRHLMCRVRKLETRKKRSESPLAESVSGKPIREMNTNGFDLVGFGVHCDSLALNGERAIRFFEEIGV